MIVLIPSIGLSPHLPQLLKSLLEDSNVETIYLFDNSSEEKSQAVECIYDSSFEDLLFDAFDGDKIILYRNPGECIYYSWNFGIEQSTLQNTPCAIFNDDIILPKGSISAALNVLNKSECQLVGFNHREPNRDVDPNAGFLEVHGTNRKGGIGGFAFIVAPNTPLIDINFKWWYGDDDLCNRILQQGKKLHIALGAPVFHPEPSTSGNKQVWVNDAIAKDSALYVQIWAGWS